jgi:type IV secretory pathway VirB4 component
MAAYWSRRLEQMPAYRREVLAVTRAPTAVQLDAITAHLCESVQAMGVSADRLADAALARAVCAGFDFDHASGWSVHPQHVRMGSTFVRGFTLRRLPGHTVSVGWLAPLLRVGVECDLAIHLAPASLGDALSTLGRRLRDFSAHRMLEGERGLVGDVHVDIALDSAFELRGRLARNLGRPLHLSITATVRARDPAELRRRGDALRLAFQSALVAGEATHFRHLAAFLTTLPLGVDHLRAVKLVDSSAAAVCLPWVDASCAEPDGYRLGATRRGQQPVRVAPFDTTRHINANIAVLAASGHGKSYVMGALMLEAAARAVDCVVIDPEGEYERIVTALGGAYVSLAPGGDVAVNVFDSGATDEEAVASFVDLVAVLREGRLSDVERAVVDRAGREACAAARRAGRVPLLHDCLPALERDAPAVAIVVARYCSGALAKLFDRETSVHIDRGLAAISLRDTPPEHVAAVTFIVAGWLWRLVRDDPRPRHVLFDEVGALCVHPPLRSLLVQLARRCRKYSASLVVASQNAQDLLSSDEGAVVVTNCATALLGGHRSAEAARMEKAFGLTEPERHFIETAARGEFLLLAGDRRLTMRVEVPPQHHALLGHQPP